MRYFLLCLLLLAMATSNMGMADRGGVLWKPIASAVQAFKQSRLAMRGGWQKALLLTATPVVLCTSLISCGGVATNGENVGEAIEQTLLQQTTQSTIAQILRTTVADSVDNIIIRHSGIIENDIGLFHEEKATLAAEFYSGAEILYKEDGRLFFGNASVFSESEPTLIKVSHPIMSYGKNQYNSIKDKVIDVNQVLSVKVIASPSHKEIPLPEGYELEPFLAAGAVAERSIIYSFQARQMGEVSFPASAAQLVNNSGVERVTKRASRMLKRAEHLYGRVVVPLSDGRQIVAVNGIKIKGSGDRRTIAAVSDRPFILDKIYVVVQGAVDGREDVTPQFTKAELAELLDNGGVAPYEWLD